MQTERRAMVSEVRQGASQRSVAKHHHVSLRTVQRWVQRALGRSLDEVDWRDHPEGPHHPANRTGAFLEEQVLAIRQELRHSDLGEYGAHAIHRALLERGVVSPPCVRTIGRILERHGALDGRRRLRRRPPPRGWYLLDVADGLAELDEFDFVEDLRIQNGPLVDVLNAVSLHGGLVNSWPHTQFRVKYILECLVARWRCFGCPAYAQFDNETRFQGPHQHPDVVGSVTRLCLALGIVPVFVPVHEHGFQAGIESYNGLWEAKVWARYHHESEDALQQQSARYVAAHQLRTRSRQESAPERKAFPEPWSMNLAGQPSGRIVYLRRSDDNGRVQILGHRFEVDRAWVHRLVRCDVLLDVGVIRFHGLRRRAPREHLLLREVPYALPQRRFRGELGC